MPLTGRVGTSLACSGAKFVVSRAGEAHDARARGANRKFRVTACGGYMLDGRIVLLAHNTILSRGS